MIRLKRVRSDKAIVAGLRGEKRKTKNRELLEGRLTGKFAFQSSHWRAARAQLKLEAAGKCAYCEASTEVVAHGDVEHFRPKSVYWWLAYCYDNMLFACQICNQVYKKDAFPVLNSRWPEPSLPQQLNADEIAAWIDGCAPDPLCDSSVLEQFLASASAEQPALLNPYIDKVDSVFRYRADDVLKEVEVQGEGPAFAACEEFYGLNREELRRWRYRTYETAELLRKVLQTDLDAGLALQIRAQLRRMASDEAAFAGMIRFFLREWALTLEEP